MNIYVGNVPNDITIDEIQGMFIPFGKVASVHIMQTSHDVHGQPKKYCFVEMASKIEGEEAINSLNGRKLRGLVVDVVAALPLSNKKRAYSSRRTD